MNAELKIVPPPESRQDARLEPHTLTMTELQENDARRRAARLLEESAKRWPPEFRR